MYNAFCVYCSDHLNIANNSKIIGNITNIDKCSYIIDNYDNLNEFLGKNSHKISFDKNTFIDYLNENNIKDDKYLELYNKLSVYNLNYPVLECPKCFNVYPISENSFSSI